MLFGPKYIQGCMFAFFICTMLSCIIDGAFLGSTDYGVMATLTNWTTKGFSMWSVPIVFGSFLLALPDMLAWDYSFFHSLGSAGAIMRLLLFVTISIGFVWGFFTIALVPVIQFMLNTIRALISRVFPGL